MYTLHFSNVSWNGQGATGALKDRDDVVGGGCHGDRRRCWCYVGESMLRDAIDWHLKRLSRMTPRLLTWGVGETVGLSIQVEKLSTLDGPWTNKEIGCFIAVQFKQVWGEQALWISFKQDVIWRKCRIWVSSAKRYLLFPRPCLLKYTRYYSYLIAIMKLQVFW